MSFPYEINRFETLAQHASDLVHWVEGSGPILQQSRVIANGFANSLNISLIDAPSKLEQENILAVDRTPSDLSLTHKPGVTVLWRRTAANNLSMKNVQGKSDAETLLNRPIEESYRVSGFIFDKQFHINPREFHLTNVGNFVDVKDASAKGHEVKLYRSVLGSKMGSLGGLEGCLQWNDGKVASWAIITCEVTLKHTTGTRSYSAQADIHGDFRLVFSALPFPKKEGEIRPPYRCKLSISALQSASGEQWHQPDDFVSVEIKEIDDNAFKDSIDFDFKTGTSQRLTSSNSDAFLIIK